MKSTGQNVPVWEQYTLSVEEAAQYFRIGENKLRKLIEENPDSKWLLMNGSRAQIKRKIFEKMIDEISSI
ncbi:MAG: excisionase [Dysosmobacter sp.]|uniref:excisionase n=1 Tax=uncultured Oscillibacter sp. TaxID=876091 RepID=UPI00262A5BFD|nr:excisionase [uncultured Oscillibacter sp.]MCX4372476.1 excisionase [Dysosmobacter sp.]